MSPTPSALIDTVDSGAHYRVKGTPDEIADRLAHAIASEVLFCKFDLCQRHARSIWIAPDKVIAILDPS